MHLVSMPGESTPLIQTVRVGPPRRRYAHQTRRRFCTIACTCLLIAGFVSFAINALLLWPIQHRHGLHSHYALSGHRGKSLSHDQLRSILLETPTAEHSKEWSYYYSSGAHLAGRNYSQADWTRRKWQDWGIEADIISYDTFINYPLDHSLTLSHREDEAAAWKVKFEASLTEDVLDEDPTSALDDKIPTFHGYSATGNATASFVFVNYGTYQDYEDLLKAGIPLRGKIAIAKYGGIFRGLKVKRAQDLGMVGVIIYSDPGDDGKMTIENGYEAYPKGPARNPSSVQRGSVQYLSVRPGDPSTPGYPSKPGAPRAPVHDAIPTIPSLPISYTDAIPLLRALNGHGPKAADINEHWNKNLGLRHEGVGYNLGPSPDNVVINLSNQQNYTTTPLWNVIGIVNGTIPNEVLIVGNHRDAWIAGGAADPHSGSAVLNEVVRSVGKAVEAGWKPLRTIVFASWDGEEYGLIGSTEWVEEYLPWLSEASVAYLNVDVGTVGPRLVVSAAPLLHQVFRRVTQLVPFPKQADHDEDRTLADVWDGKISTMGSGSDFTAFQDFAGIPSIDFSFKDAVDSPVYHYHSNYDSFHWMDKFGDPGFKFHETGARLLGLMLGELTDSIVISFSAADYAEALTGYLDRVEDKLKGKAILLDDDDAIALRGVVSAEEARGSASALEASLKTVRESLVNLREKAQDLDELAAWAEGRLEAGLPWWDVIGKIKLWLAISKANKQYKYLERHFLFEGGLDGRSWFKHVVFAPGLWTGYSGAVYPGLMESIDARDYNNGLKWAGIIKRCIERATVSLS